MNEVVCAGSPQISVRVRRNSRARRLVLRIGRAGPVVTAPPGLSVARIRTFLNDNSAWIGERMAAMPAAIRVEDGAVLPFRGGQLVISNIGGGRLRLSGDVLLVPGVPENTGRLVAAFLRTAARDACAEGVSRHAAAAGCVARRISLRDTRARWGSCTAAGDVMFSWRLVMAPPEVLDYVVAHEVAHLRELNHGPRFWNLVETLCPDFRAQRDWLRREGPGLHGWDFHPVAV